MCHRTYGDTRNCKGCRYWSEMIAMSVCGGPVQALCLNKASPRAAVYVYGSDTCPAWASGHLGAIDEPGQEPGAYAAEEGIRAALDERGVVSLSWPQDRRPDRG